MLREISFHNDDGYNIRPFRKSEWKELRDIRLEALKNHSDVFASNYADESLQSEQDWLTWIETDGSKCTFALFNTASKVIGMTSIVTAREDITGQTAKLCASYISESEKGKGLSDLLYKARIAWAKAQDGRFKSIIVSHREGNEASRRANQKYGFQHTHTQMVKWPDNQFANEVFYKLNL
jgi:RimJ/RimL family protein N-acetyltransferase